MKKILIVLLLAACTLPVCAKQRQSEEIITPMTHLEKRQFQTRSYNNEASTLLMKGLLDVLQDEGYIVYNVNSTLGFIYAVKDYNISAHDIDISKEFGLTKSRLKYNGVKVATMEATANITEYGNTARGRINFKRKLLNEYGNAQFIEDINNAEYYGDFYQKLDSAIKLQKETNQKITPAPTPLKPVKRTVKPALPYIKGADTTNNPENETTIEPKNEEQTMPKPQNIKQPKLEIESTDIKGTPVQIINDAPQTQQPEQKSAKESAKELKEQIKQAKQEAKEAEKQAAIQAKELDKQIKEAEKQAAIEAKLQAKELKEEEKAAKKEAKQQVVKEFQILMK